LEGQPKQQHVADGCWLDPNTLITSGLGDFFQIDGRVPRLCKGKLADENMGRGVRHMQKGRFLLLRDDINNGDLLRIYRDKDTNTIR